MGAPTGVKGSSSYGAPSSHRAAIGSSRLLLMEAPSDLLLGAPRELLEVAHREQPLQQLPLAFVEAPVGSNLEGSSSWKLLRELKKAPTGAKGSSYGAHSSTGAARGSSRLLLMEATSDLLLGAPRSRELLRNS